MKNYKYYVLLFIIYTSLGQYMFSLHILSFFDELLALSSILFLPKINKIYIRIFILISICVTFGLIGNSIYKIQVIQAVLMDLCTFFKYFLILFVGFKIYPLVEKYRKKLIWHCKVILLLLLPYSICYIFKIIPTLNVDKEGIAFEGNDSIFGISINHFHTGIAFWSLALWLFGCLCNYKPLKTYLIIPCILLFLSLTSSGGAVAVLTVFLCFFFFWKNRKVPIWGICLSFILAIPLFIDDLIFYFNPANSGARALLAVVSIDIGMNFFPFGSGLATFATYPAFSYYSDLFRIYGLDKIGGLEENGRAYFGSDTFWAAILAQTGFIGCCFYISTLCYIYFCINKIKDANVLMPAYISFMIPCILSVANSSFFNALSVLPALVLGCAFRRSL